MVQVTAEKIGHVCSCCFHSGLVPGNAVSSSLPIGRLLALFSLHRLFFLASLCLPFENSSVTLFGQFYFLPFSMTETHSN